MSENFLQAVKDFHARLNSAAAPAAAPRPPVATQAPTNATADAIKLIKRFPQLLMPRTGK
jgi:hypothetical protein